MAAGWVAYIYCMWEELESSWDCTYSYMHLGGISCSLNTCTHRHELRQNWAFMKRLWTLWKSFSFNTQWIHLTRYTCSFILFIFSVMFNGHKLWQNTHTHTRATNSSNNRKTKEGQKVNGHCTVSFGMLQKVLVPARWPYAYNVAELSCSLNRAPATAL